MKYLIKLKRTSSVLQNDIVTERVVVWNLWMDNFNLMIVRIALQLDRKI